MSHTARASFIHHPIVGREGKDGRGSILHYQTEIWLRQTKNGNVEQTLADLQELSRRLYFEEEVISTDLFVLELWC